jgi:hypothetical protein
MGMQRSSSQQQHGQHLRSMGTVATISNQKGRNLKKGM